MILDLRDASPALVARFWAKVDRRGDDECWPWLAMRDRDGYGKFGLSAGRMVPAHRVALALNVGVIAADEQACHRCDNPPCCNPRHLFAGSIADNAADRNAKGRQPRGARHGMHKLSDADVIEVRSLLAAGLSQTAIAARFGVKQPTISDIKTGRKWSTERAEAQLYADSPATT